MKPKGRFISFEGSEGSGKSTQIRLLLHRLEQEGISAEILREPGGTILGEEIRHLLKYSPKGEGMTQEAELLLFAASRAQLVREKVIPALERGEWVLADRFMDSTTVYQGVARGLPLDVVEQINLFAVGGCKPEVTFLLDLDVALSRRRLLAANRTLDRLEKEPAAFFEKVRQGYLDVAQKEGKRIVLLDATETAEALSEKIWTILQSRVNVLSH